MLPSAIDHADDFEYAVLPARVARDAVSSRLVWETTGHDDQVIAWHNATGR